MKLTTLFRSFPASAGIFLLSALASGPGAHAQQWPLHGDPAAGGLQRTLHYKPEGEAFVKVSGTAKFNRALYGTNTAFRVEAGDLPEFALYMPGMGGNLRLALVKGDSSKWITAAKEIATRYLPGCMEYTLKDPWLGSGSLEIRVLAMAHWEGMLLRVSAALPKGTDIKLGWLFGGASGKNFSRNGDIGADPESSFYLHPGNCNGNIYTMDGSVFRLAYGAGVLPAAQVDTIRNTPVNKPVPLSVKNLRFIRGIFPGTVRETNAVATGSFLENLNAAKGSAPVAGGVFSITGNGAHYAALMNALSPGGRNQIPAPSLADLPTLWTEAEAGVKAIAGRVKLHTPDPWINTLGGPLALAGDAIWEDPTFLHGAVAWRMRLNAWRGAYVADPLGWHDRARTHFSSYARSQVVTPPTGPVVADTALRLARQLEKIGTSMFSSGYICRNPNGDIRPHHYDMNLVFIDQLLTHFNWTGDTAYVKEMWPVIERHLAWEKRNFDADNDGLYDAYCCIWASDALQYSGGGVTHSSAYNYRANKMAAFLARLAGRDGTMYEKEAEKIRTAVNANLWLSRKGWYAEYKDALGGKNTHDAPGLWTIYHALESGLPDPFQGYLATGYIGQHIPHIPVEAKLLPEKGLYMLSTTNWQPYTWSVNNVALAEQLHTALACWQAGRDTTAFTIWKSALVESMYLGASPGGFQQLSYLDAKRGELYRDFADPVGMAARSLTEGLFGIMPDALNDTLHIKPGLPPSWLFASLETPPLDISFKRKGDTEQWKIVPRLKRSLCLELELPARTVLVPEVYVNGKKLASVTVVKRIGTPAVSLRMPKDSSYEIEIRWKGAAPEKTGPVKVYHQQGPFTVSQAQARITSWYDPTGVLAMPALEGKNLEAYVTGKTGAIHTFFVELQQGDMRWYAPVPVEVREPVTLVATKEQPADALRLQLVTDEPAGERDRLSKNGRQVAEGGGMVTERGGPPAEGRPTVIKGGPALSKRNGSFAEMDQLTGKGRFREEDLHFELNGAPATWKKQDDGTFLVSGERLAPGTNIVRILRNGAPLAEQAVINWNVKASFQNSVHVDLSTRFNDAVTNIFRNRYLSPRPSVPTLQIPVQGIGNWCYPLIEPVIDDSGLRTAAGAENRFSLSNGLVFSTPSAPGKNILFTSLWDNFPDSALIPVSGKASHAYFLMAGTTNHMQSRFNNGLVTVTYTDGTEATLVLRNPETWWPIEQDYVEEGPAFTTGLPAPPRISLKTGKPVTRHTGIKGFSDSAVEGGAATVLDLPLDPSKELRSIMVKTLANEVVIGVMGITLVH